MAVAAREVAELPHVDLEELQPFRRERPEPYVLESAVEVALDRHTPQRGALDSGIAEREPSGGETRRHYIPTFATWLRI